MSNTVVLNPSKTPTKVVSKDLVLAWAKDIKTEEPRYIGELREDQTGQKCGCQCYSCNLPLEAVNAGKIGVKPRPHFRHPDGAPKADCMVLSARAAALELLIKDGQISLPRRRKSVEVAGLSGKYHEAWVEHPREMVRIASAQFEDRVTAIVTLEDGRQFRIGIIGSIEAPDDQADIQTTIPTIRFIVDDPAIADMSPDELRKRVTSIVDDGEWCSHWNDALLAQQALDVAQQKAIDALDWIDGDYDIPDDLTGDLRRETLLHLKAKEILEKEQRIRLPDLFVKSEALLPSGMPVEKASTLEGQVIHLESVCLEKPMGQIKPDVCAVTIEDGHWPAQQLLIEITVTNTIKEERLERIRAKNLPTLEIDISRMGGVVSFEEFKRLIVDEVAGKYWLHHPWMEQEKSRLDVEIQIEVNAAVVIKQRKAEQEQKKQALLQLPIEQLSQAYLEAIETYGWYRARAYDGPDTDKMPMAHALDKVYDFAKALAARGYPEAKDTSLFIEQGNLLDRLLSFKLDKAVGYKIDTAWQVINAILQEKAPYIEWQTLYLTAIKVYKPTLTGAQEIKVAIWRSKVFDSLNSGKDEYRRCTKYDRFISFLFPEMANLLKIPLPGSKPQKETALKSTSDIAKDNSLRWGNNHATSQESGNTFKDAKSERLVELAKRYRDRGFAVENVIVECSIRQKATWNEIISAWTQAGLIEGSIDFAKWKRTHPNDAKWLFGG